MKALMESSGAVISAGSEAATSKTRMMHQHSSGVGRTMSECLEDPDDPIMALQAMAASSAEMIRHSAQELQKMTFSSKDIPSTVPPLLCKDSVSQVLSSDTTSTAASSLLTSQEDHPLRTVLACSESIVASLNKISSGGKQASNEIRALEQKKRQLDHHAAVLLAAVAFRQQSARAVQAYASQSWYEAAEAIRPWLMWQQQQHKGHPPPSPSRTTPNSNASAHSKTASDEDDVMNDPRLAIYTGEYSLQQLQVTYDQLRKTLLSLYETAVKASDLQTLGKLTPILAIIQLEFDGLRLYKVYLLSVLEKSMQEAMVVNDAIPPPTGKNTPSSSASPPPYVAMGRVYNVAVSTLRHHLPMVSHCLYRADGDVSMIQLVHNQTEQTIIPIVQQYQSSRQLARVSRTAIQIYSAIEDRYTGRGMVNHGSNMDSNGQDDTSNQDDCGFSYQIGTLSDVAVTMEEVAICIQHTESYLRFVQHTCMEVNRARKIRHEQTMERNRFERERHEWAGSGKNNSSSSIEDDKGKKNEEATAYQDVEILSHSTPLHECIAEVGGQYAAIERCLLIASMQRAFDYTNDDDAKSYRPMSTLSSSSSSNTNATTNVDAWQTILVETCWYAARRGTQRAFATGHTGTASAVTNFVVECLTDVCLPVLTRRSEEYGVHPLKPGDGLLVGSVNLFNNASNLIRQGGGAVTSLQLPTSVTTTAAGGSNKNKMDEFMRKQKREEGIIRACAMMNDIEVAIHHTKQLESILYKLIDKGFAPNTHETEQLRMCVKALGPVADSFLISSNATIEALETILKPRIRSIVGDAVGSNDTSTFMGAVTTTTLGGSTKSHFGGDHGRSDMMRMNYNLDEEAYNLLQLSEGYVSRLCTLLDELLGPLRKHLAPRLWDTLLLQVMGTVCKRLETSLRKCEYTALGGLTLDSDMRDLLSYTKDHLHSPDYNSNNVAILKACPALSKLLQIAKLLSVDELEDVSDLIASFKRKGNWDLKSDDTKAFLYLRVEFDATRVNEVLRLPDDE
jgi:conserved oligomeric Golgi complex subunit 4